MRVLSKLENAVIVASSREAEPKALVVSKVGYLGQEVTRNSQGSPTVCRFPGSE